MGFGFGGVVKRWHGWVLASAAGVACASFAVLNYFQSYVVLLVALAAFCGQFTSWCTCL